MPRVTVLMSVYNGDRYLLESIESILNQTFRDFELLIINDGSTDKTREIILSLNDPRIRLVDNEQNIGLTQSLNKGLRLAKGDFVARQDADDLSVPERLQQQVDFLDQHPEVALLGTWHQEVDVNGNPTGVWDLPSSWIDLRWAILFYTPFVHSSIMMRKDLVLSKVGFYNEVLSYSQDYELWSRITDSLPAFSLSQRLVKTRINSFSMTATYGSKTLEGFRIRATKVAHLLNLDQIDATLKELYLNQITMFLFNFSYSPEIKFERLNREDISRIIERILQLHQAFWRANNLNQTEVRKQRLEVYSQISNRLLILARHHLEQNRNFAGFLLMQAFRLRPFAVLTKDYFKVALMLLLNPQAVQTLKQTLFHFSSR